MNDDQKKALQSNYGKFFEYAELKAAYFTPSAADMLNDTFLGLSVVVLALIIWVVYKI